jgi:hypothetical protein
MRHTPEKGKANYWQFARAFWEHRPVAPTLGEAVRRRKLQSEG